MHAMTIMVYFHSWSCFCLANGVKLESDMNFFIKEKVVAEEKVPVKQEPNDQSSFFCKFC